MVWRNLGRCRDTVLASVFPQIAQLNALHEDSHSVPYLELGSLGRDCG